MSATNSTFCALGSVLSDFRLDYLTTVYARFSDISEQTIDAWYDDVHVRAKAALRDVMSEIAVLRLVRTADVRYLGQGFHVSIPFERMAELPENFRAEYRKLYGDRHDDAPMEVINFRATVVGVTRKPLPKWSSAEPVEPGRRERDVFFGGAWQACPVHCRDAMRPGWTARGPFLVDQADTTVAVTAGWEAEVDSLGNILLQKGHQAG